MKQHARLLFTLLLLVMAKDVLAGTGYCTPVSGTVSLSYNWGTYNISDPAKNTPGYTTPTKQVTASGSTQTLNCSCDGGPYFNIWMWGEPTAAVYNSANNVNFYRIPGNDYLAVGTEVWSTQFHTWNSLPFGPIQNYRDKETKSMSCNQDFTIQLGSNHTGTQARFSFEVIKPFVGTSYIPNVTVGNLYWTLGADGSSSHGPQPSAYYQVSGTVTVPQNCVINAGQIVTVDFGTLYSGGFKHIGQKPDDSPIKTFHVPIQCTNIGAPANLTLRLQATADTHYPAAIASDNPNVGVMVTDDQNTVLRVNDSSSQIPFMTDVTGNANVTLKAYPVSTTGQTPAEGVFMALAYLRIDFA